MRIRWLCFLVSFTLCGSVHAQADIQAMIKQIAKLEIYIIDLEKGYSIAKKGLTTIGEIRNGEFNLHSIFFSSLQSVNTSVARYSKIAEIISDQLAIVSNFKTLIKNLNNSGRLTTNEMNYIGSIYSNMSNECTKNLNELITVITDGKLEMTDDERIKRIDIVWSDMNDKYAFTQSFVRDSGYLNNARNSETNETQFLKSLE